LGVPVLVMRENTERPEAIEAGVAKLVGTDEARIAAEVVGLLSDTAEYMKMSVAQNPYGDGHAVERCLAAVERHLALETQNRR
ncbi:UDP-N-acetylglucosamine 2-epimerase, partial [Arthrobacter sp.]|uniref:UDP-N-acetylglucosamine 2-epimerase n=1 Tax=Arthrobacter sp. TaxID=1667 RepID=UPI00289845ED